MDKKFKAKILIALRKLTWQYAPINDAEKVQKKYPKTHECEGCGMWVYSGAKSEEKILSDLENANLKPPKGLILSKIYRDHIEPVEPLEPSGEWSWDVHFNRLFCSQDNIQILCKPCHDTKSKEESKLRKKYRDSKKKKK